MARTCRSAVWWWSSRGAGREFPRKRVQPWDRSFSSCEEPNQTVIGLPSPQGHGETILRSPRSAAHDHDLEAVRYGLGTALLAVFALGGRPELGGWKIQFVRLLIGCDGAGAAGRWDGGDHFKVAGRSLAIHGDGAVG